MLDQSFSADNFRKILDIENRKGIHVEDKLSILKVRRINNLIRECNKRIRDLKRSKDYNEVEKEKDNKKKLRKKKEIVLKKELEKTSKKVTSKGFKISLNQVVIPDSKPIYTVSNIPEYYFTLKQLQKNIYSLYGVKQADRSAIVEQVKLLLDDKFPKIILRTDIKSFYESLDHDQIQKRIIDDNILSPFSKRVLKQLLHSYIQKSGNKKGVPRGIGVSAYLAELFMRDIDNDIKAIENVTYYARFVDDILIIFTPKPFDPNRDYHQDVKNIIEKKYGLTLNTDKTKLIDLRNNSQIRNLEYLGYEFKFGNGKVKTYISTKKKDKYKNRIELAFDTYIQQSRENEKKARKILVKRIRFICGNTKLTNNKKNIPIGIYYSNPHLTELNDLKGLDHHLRNIIQNKIDSDALKKRLLKYGFEDGFRNKKYSPFSSSELKKIMSVWKKNRL